MKNSDGIAINGGNNGAKTQVAYRKKLTQFFTDANQALGAVAAFCDGLPEKAHRYNERTLREAEQSYSRLAKVSKANHDAQLMEQLATAMNKMTEAKKLAISAHLNSKRSDVLCSLAGNLSGDQLLELALRGKDMSDPKVMLSTLKSIHQNAKVHHYNECTLREDELSDSSAAQVLQANHDALMEQLTTVNNKMIEAKELADFRAKQMPEANYDALIMEQLVTVTNKMIEAKKLVTAAHLNTKVWNTFHKALLMEMLDTLTKIRTEVEKSADSSELKVLNANIDTLKKQLATVTNKMTEAKKLADSRVAQMSQTNHDALIIEQLVTAANLNSKICDALSSMTSSLSDNQLLELAFGGKDVSDPKVMLSILKNTHPETVSQANPYAQVMEQSATVNNKMTEAKKLADSRVAQAPKANHDALMVEQLVITTNMTIKAKKLDAAAHLNSKIWDTLTSMANNLSDDQLLELTFGGKDMSDPKVVLSVLKSIHQNAKAHSYNESI